MKRILIFVISLISIFVLAGCQDKKIVDDEIRVFFFHHNGSPLNQIIVVDDPEDILVEPEVGVRPGYDFVGWFEDSAHTIPHYFNTPVGEKSMILYGKWTTRPFSITYHLNGGEFLESQIVHYTYETGQLVLFPAPRKRGYTFKSWYTYDGPTKVDDIGHNSTNTLPPEDLVLYAHWAARVSSVSFNVNFPTTGGPDRPSTVKAVFDQPIDFPQLPDTGGYVFLGWNDSKDGTGTWYINGDIYNTVRDRVTLYAIWG